MSQAEAGKYLVFVLRHGEFTGGESHQALDRSGVRSVAL
ncbi:hypothetical protein I546_6965 [Mycobacterium kansasii 732]|nr:hypothetical protein I546_6965 [Mycobacterium kansasii 732]